MSIKSVKFQQKLLSGIEVKTITAEEAIDVVETQFGVKLFAYQKWILKTLWRKSYEKDRPLV